MKTALAFVALALLCGSVAANAQAYGPQGYGQVPGPHPAYLHALSDLRAARHYLNDGWAWEPVRAEDNKAIREIDAAINNIKMAAIDDGKGLNDPFPIDGHLTPQNRFAKANELLYAAHQDLAKAEDVPQSPRPAQPSVAACGCGAQHGRIRQSASRTGNNLGTSRCEEVPQCAWLLAF